MIDLNYLRAYLERGEREGERIGGRRERVEKGKEKKRGGREGERGWRNRE